MFNFRYFCRTNFNYRFMRYKIRLSYNGLTLSGWQRQNNAATVQEEISKALSTLLGCEIEVVGAGRTDAKVNAVNYIAHFDAPESEFQNAGGLRYKLNAILTKNIVIHDISPVDENFHARFSATSREYHYFLHRQKDPFMENFSWFCAYPLDIEAMNAAAQALLGEHDFSCFEKTGGNNLTSICTVYEARWERWTPPHVGMMGFPAGDDDYLVFRIRANRFLRNMVRAIVGSLIDIGRGRHGSEWISELIASGDRCKAGESVPGNALFLSDVRYDNQ